LDDDPKLVDLPPHQWKSEREKPHEPMFGAGWPVALGMVVFIIVATILIHYEIVPRVVAGGLGAVAGGLASMFASAFQR
jgi:hypothetical protein